MRKVTPTVKFAPEYGAYPLWINTTNEEGIPEPEAPVELDDCPDILANLDRIEDIYNSLFINNEIEFAWKGFDTQDEFEEYKALVLETLAMLHERLDGLYKIEDHTNVVGYKDPRTPWVRVSSEAATEEQQN